MCIKNGETNKLMWGLRRSVYSIYRYIILSQFRRKSKLISFSVNALQSFSCPTDNLFRNIHQFLLDPIRSQYGIQFHSDLFGLIISIKPPIYRMPPTDKQTNHRLSEIIILTVNRSKFCLSIIEKLNKWSRLYKIIGKRMPRLNAQTIYYQ